MSLLKLLEALCSKISSYSLLLMAGITFTDVFGRVFFNAPLGFAYELVAILLAVSFYSGLYHVNRKRKHIQIDLLEKYFQGTLGIILNWFCYLLEIVFFSALVKMMYEQTMITKNFGEVFMFLGIEKWKVLIFIFGLAVIALISLVEAFPEVINFNKKEVLT
jgi:TRAP-type C4-dicarboxylate transport system permease small subunit